MKKLILSLIAASFVAPSFAQGNCAGGFLLYGVGSYSSMRGSDTRSFSNANSVTTDRPRQQNWEISPGLGFNINEYLTVGVDFNYTGSKTTYDRNAAPTNFAGVEDLVKTYDYAIGPFVRFTQPFGKRFFGFGQLEAHYLHGQVSTRTVTPINTSFTRDDKYKGVDVSYMPGVGVYVTHSVALTFGIGGISYAYQKYDYSTQLSVPGSEHTAKVSDFNVTFGRQFNIGVQKTLGCRKMRRHHAEPMDETRHMDTHDDSNNSNSGDE